MRHLIARLISSRVRWLEQDRERTERLARAESRRLRAQLDQARAAARAAEQTMAMLRSELSDARSQAGLVEQWRSEALQLRRSHGLLDERLAVFEGRAPGGPLPTRTRRRIETPRHGAALADISRQATGGATGGPDPYRTVVIPAVQGGHDAR